mmetsp:Transcript_23421/g.64987  ORF Transcript_23421/g.64987 Transcript_23421/m.64987 type:complete len:292 (-) Transcript_23421:278-1153(-)
MINPPELISVMKGSFKEFHMRLLRNAPGALIMAFAMSRFRTLVTVPRTYLNSFISDTKCLSFRSPDLVRALSTGKVVGSSHPTSHISSSAARSSDASAFFLLSWSFRDFSTGDTPTANSRTQPSRRRPFSIQTRFVKSSKHSAMRESSSRSSVGDRKSTNVVIPRSLNSSSWSFSVASPSRPIRKSLPGTIGEEDVEARSRQFFTFSRGKFRSAHSDRISSLNNLVSSSSFSTASSTFVFTSFLSSTLERSPRGALIISPLLLFRHSFFRLAAMCLVTDPGLEKASVTVLQ